jgi:predicted ester cyclase
MEPIVGLIRKFAVGFFNGQNPSVCQEIMAPDYRLRMGDAVIAGRDAAYLPAVQSQFAQFPGLTMTIHQVITSGSQLAVSLTEHGASGGPGGRTAAWAGIALYEWNGQQLTGCVAVEDYHARRRQLTSGVPDPIAPPAVSPWDITAAAWNPSAEAVVGTWLSAVSTVSEDGVLRDDEHLAGNPPLVFEPTTTHVTHMFSAGHHVAFHAIQTGRYLSGFDGIDASPHDVTLFSAGIVAVVDGRVLAGRVIRDRAALHRALRPPK